MNREQISAGILAGGRSLRMGENKAHLMYRGNTFLENVINACAGFGETIISVDDANKYPEVKYPLYEDELKGFGPVEGIFQLLVHARHDYVFILATDMPHIDSRILARMAERISGREDCLVLTSKGKKQPMCSIYRKSVLPVLKEMRSKDEHKVGLLFTRVQTSFVGIEELLCTEDTICNINTREEYQQILDNHFDGDGSAANEADK